VAHGPLVTQGDIGCDGHSLLDIRAFNSRAGGVLSGEHLVRRLMAILAADVAGYSRLMGADEEGTLVDLQTFRKTLVDTKIVERRRLIVIRSSVGAGHSRNNVLVAWVI
jgi:hypothetical protein